MMGKLSFFFCSLCIVNLSQSSPQFYPSPYPGQQPYPGPQDNPYSGGQPWQSIYRTNISNPNPQPNPVPIPNSYSYPNPYYNPNTQRYPAPSFADDVNRPLYGVPPPPSQTSGYPQIYKIDNLIIIANPPQQPQPCIPQPRPPLQFPDTNPTDNRDDLLNRLPDEEPSKCTWAIVACCSPDNVKVRYNCFELLGCPGFFFDNSPCEPKIVMAAANAALEFYRTAGNNTTPSTSSPMQNTGNSNNNQI